jgi:hypothetical protein
MFALLNHLPLGCNRISTALTSCAELKIRCSMSRCCALIRVQQSGCALSKLLQIVDRDESLSDCDYSCFAESFENTRPRATARASNAVPVVNSQGLRIGLSYFAASG